jgi:hypothetical protein
MKVPNEEGGAGDAARSELTDPRIIVEWVEVPNEGGDWQPVVTLHGHSRN